MEKPEIKDDFIGHTIRGIRWMTDKEKEEEGWEDTNNVAPVLILDNGAKIYPSQDSEGNGPGMLFGTDPKGEARYIMPEGTPKTKLILPEDGGMGDD